ncbi:C2 domain-containing protein 3 isoform X3 [Dunckerocampus dactyliophorus]|uniref:C2 domain-containing protein 3 isoform X3 n=1 Tax=Dunckerocampus dactyliophorus TaxID=161453 RepID=UPI002404B947|nr:C2 domain-containing protein 3 isoform X3 [Dunckerocampus dactyliophorus]
MYNRRLRSVKVGDSKKKVPSDVPPSTSLPPLVEGQLRCFLRVTVSQLLWTTPKPPPLATFVRLRWWGESSNGTHFYPRDASLSVQKNVKTTARFPVRCGPKQLTSYLADMGSLVLEVLNRQDHLPIARAQVTEISRLSQLHAISGFYTLVSPTSKKLGELEVSLHLEPLVEVHESTSSGPTADFSSEGLQVSSLATSAEPAALKASSEKKSDRCSEGSTSRWKERLYSQTTRTDKDEPGENVRLVEKSLMALRPSSQEPCGQPSNDILSVILERGSKLRDAMVVSALKCDMVSAPVLKDLQLPLQRDNTRPPSLPSPSRMFLENILPADSAPKHTDDAVVTDGCLDNPAEMDHRAVDLLLGRLKTSPPPLWEGEPRFPESPSSHSSVCGDSELSDPQYDQSLLEHLFYTTPLSGSRLDDTSVDAREQKNSSSKTENRLRQSGSRTSDNPAGEPQHSLGEVAVLLSPEQLTFLSLMRLAKVSISSMSVPADGTTPPARKSLSKGKIPPLQRNKKFTYFVEYTFPKTSSSSRNIAGDRETTRVVSTKVTEGVVRFHQDSVFPVHFSKTAIEQWWATDLLFKIYSRRSDQKKVDVIGQATYPLRRLLQSKQLSQSLALPVYRREDNSQTQELGLLRVLLELSTNSRDSSETRDPSLLHVARSPPRESSHVSFCVEDSPARSSEDFTVNVTNQQKLSKVATPHLGPHTCASQQQVAEDPEVLLHTLLMVPDGKNFNSGPMQTVNVYLNCKLFWCNEMARSAVSWGCANPSFNFAQVTPVALTTKLLERMKNNVMVIEVWQKTGCSNNERLLGLVKLPLHQFYMSFRDHKIAHLLLQAQYPVLGVDCYMPVVDVFSGSCKGHLRVTLAMGRFEQVLALQRTREDEMDSLGRLGRPLHLLDHQPHAPTKVTPAQARAMKEHVFLIRVDKVIGLTPLQSTVWGEADCYVQYSFPCQEGAEVHAALDINLRPFRTTTTLCVPDPTFGHTETHVLLTPEGMPVQKLLLSSLSSQGLHSGGGVHFEVWCRYYYPNVRDQLVAKGILPLSKLCAMVTMHGQQPDKPQMFSLPLLPRADNPSMHQPQPSGLLDVCVQYKSRPVRADVQTGRGAASSQVTLVVQVHRGSGFQAAARVVAQQDERFSYFAAVGVNSYVTIQLSLLPEEEQRCTRMAARTFCPEYNHHTEVCCAVLLHKSSGETFCLAEQLAESSAVFTVWNRDSRRGSTFKPADVILGTVKIPLLELLSKTTGISGWFGVHTPQESTQSNHVLVGGLEISIAFAHHSERERVIRAALDLGWDPARFLIDNEWPNEQGDWEHSARKISLTFSMPRVWIPVHCLLLPGHAKLQRSTYCYFRYKFYEQEAFCSQMKHPCVSEEGEGDRATVTFQGSRTVELMSSQPLLWYLQEERLEVQVWVAFQKDKSQRPRDTDRLVGSAFIDMSSLAKIHQQKFTLSGVYPLFRRSAIDLQGAALRVHISLTLGCVPTVEDDQADSDSQEETLLEAPESAHHTPPPSPPNITCSETPDVAVPQPAKISEEESFPVDVAVERAMHLTLKGCPQSESSEGEPCCSVSYVTADSAEAVSTAVVANTNCPAWNHQHKCRLSKQLLVDPEQSLVFKVWHKGDRGEVEQVIGFASVDLSPLLCGLQSVCGWYNVTGFSGQCHGQLKVSITPLECVQDLREQRKAAFDKAGQNSSVLSRTASCSYQTTATYNSFPSHISRYPEQHISSPDRMGTLFSKTESDRHHEHMQKVRLHHQSLQEQNAEHSVCSSTSGVINPSSSLLFLTLRKNLSELANIQRYFSSKIVGPALSPTREAKCLHKKDAHEDHELHVTSQQVHTGQRQPAISSVLHGSSTFSPTRERNPHTVPEIISSARNTSVFSQESSSCPTKCAGLAADGVPQEEAEDTGSEECKSPCGSEGDDEEEDYDEFVVKPRHLNEVTTLTDKTSPWNSILSDSAPVSSGSPEAEESQVHKDESQIQSQDSGRKHAREESRRCSADSFRDSSEEASDSGSDEDVTLQAVDTTNMAGDAGSPRTAVHADDPKRQVSVPNFFLPSHQLEASLRVVRLAPSFCHASSDTDCRTPPRIPRRGPRRCPDMSPTSMKRETERFARIIATHFDDDDDD